MLQSVAAQDERVGGISVLPTPWVIAHRGGPLLWPEQTMAAYNASTVAGNHFVETDCRLLSNGVVILMHDSTMERTTNHRAAVRDVQPREWNNIWVDEKKLLGTGSGRYEVPKFDEVLVKFGNKKIILAEAKDYPSGIAIVEKLKSYRISKDWVIVNAGAVGWLRPAIAAGYKTLLILEDMKQSPRDLKKQKVWGVTCPNPVTEEYVKSMKAVGLKVIGYTVNRHVERDRLVQIGVDGFPTDDPLYLDYSQAYRRTSDPFATQKWAPGMLEGQPGGRGYFKAPNKWGLDGSDSNTFKSCLQGWMCPIGGNATAPRWTMDLTVSVDKFLRSDRWFSVAVMTTDAAIDSDIPSHSVFGYNILFRGNGTLELIKYSGEKVGSNGSPTIGKASGPPQEIRVDIRYRIEVTETSISVRRLDADSVLTVNDSSFRGAYVSFGVKGVKAEFSNVKLRIP